MRVILFWLFIVPHYYCSTYYIRINRISSNFILQFRTQGIQFGCKARELRNRGKKFPLCECNPKQSNNKYITVHYVLLMLSECAIMSKTNVAVVYFNRNKWINTIRGCSYTDARCTAKLKLYRVRIRLEWLFLLFIARKIATQNLQIYLIN